MKMILRDPQPIAVRPPYFYTRCERCGWEGSSEQVGLARNWDDADCVCHSCDEIFLCNEAIPSISPRERELARHALGLDGRRKRSYRNRYAVDECGEDYATWRRMEHRSLATSFLPTGATMIFFRCTTAGALAALMQGEELDQEDFPR